jgi:23S rRNA (guanosine2251-2'-O)-methyltransferase
MIVYGRRAVREALRGRRAVTRAWATARTAREPWLEGVPVETADADALTRLCGSDAHQGVCAQADAYPYADADALLETADALIVALDQVQDPHNLGAVCRSAEAAGATGVVVPERRAAHVTPAVCKASAGAVEHLALARVRNLADFLLAAREAGCWCYGAAAGAPTGYDAIDLSGSVVLVLGGEGAGLRPRVAGACDALVSIPLSGRVESLNVSAAAAVLLFEARRRRGAP